MRSVLLLAAASVLFFVPAGWAQDVSGLDRGQLLEDLRILAADDMEGREAGSPGAARPGPI